MEKSRPRSSWLESALYRIRILGTLDKHGSEYYGSMTIMHANDPHYGSLTVLTGRLADQCALIGVLNALHDFGCLILSAEYLNMAAL